MSLELIEAARVLGFSPEQGWPEKLTSKQAAKLQTLKIKDTRSADLEKALNMAVATGTLKATSETKRVLDRAERHVIPSTFNFGSWPERYTNDGVRYAYTEPAQYRDETTHHIEPEAFAAWLAANNLEPSRHVAAWIGANGEAIKARLMAELEPFFLKDIDAYDEQQRQIEERTGQSGRTLTFPLDAKFNPAKHYGHQATQVQTAPAPKRRILKRKALIAELENEWPTIQADLKDASRNGLTEAAHAEKGWDVDNAKEWADSRGKLRKTESAKAAPTSWPGQTMFHRIK